MRKQGEVVLGEPKSGYVVVIPRWHPRRLNELLACRHWGKRHRLKKADQNMVAAYCHQAGVPLAAGKRRVSLRITLGPRQRGADPDAYWKVLLDALVECGRLKDDSRQWCEVTPVEYDRGPERVTTITMEDVG